MSNLHERDVTMTDVIEHLCELIADEFQNEVASVYFGDVGQYPPQAFKSQRGEDLAAVAVGLHHNDYTEDVSAAQERRTLGINIIVMVNMIPYFEAMPTEAFGERKLADLITRIYEYLASSERSTLGGRVSFGRVKDIQFNWAARGAGAAVREGTILYEADLTVQKM